MGYQSPIKEMNWTFIIQKQNAHATSFKDMTTFT